MHHVLFYTNIYWKTKYEMISLAEELRVTCHYLNSTNVFLTLIVLEESILEDESPHVVTESVCVQMTLFTKECQYSHNKDDVIY